LDFFVVVHFPSEQADLEMDAFWPRGSEEEVRRFAT
jgi:hypothetical protein